MTANILGSASFVSLFVLVVLLVLAMAMLSGRSRPGNNFHAADYAAKPLLSIWEAKASLDIRTSLPAGYYACPQARLADMLVVRAGDASRRQAALDRVTRLSVDFAIIDWSGRVALVIELDDRTHSRADRIERDGKVDAIMRQCGISVVHVRPGQKVSVAAQLSRLPTLA